MLHLLRRLLPCLGQTFPDGGLFIPAHFPACELLEGRRDGVGIPAFEKDQVAGLLGGGVLLQGEIHMILFRHMGKSLDILVADLDIGETGVLSGKLL